MVKFRCLSCGQKIAVNDAGIGVVIACPTCHESLIVPPQTDFEFQHAAVATREAVLPQLARLMKDRLLHGLLAQRQELMASQDAAADQIDAIEQRVALIQAKMQRRLAYYEERIAALEAENRELRQAQEYRPLGQRMPLAAGLVLSA